MYKKRLFLAVFTLVGCIIGAGILGIPSVVAKAGFWTGVVEIIAIGLFFMFINLTLGEVTLRTEGSHQLSYYAQKYLGKQGKRWMFLSLVIGIYGAMIAYLIGEGQALASIVNADPFLCGTIVFVILSYLIYTGLGATSKAESVIIPTVIVITIILFLTSLNLSKPANFTGFNWSTLLIPYGVIFFAFTGASAVPDVKKELEDNKKELKKAIMIGSLIPIIVYLLFTAAIVGVLGKNTNEIGSIGVGMILGQNWSFIGGIFAMLTMSTSFLALGTILKENFEENYGFRKNSSWLLACFVPYILYFLFTKTNVAGFSKVIDVTGVITGTIAITLIILMSLKAKKKGTRKPEYSLPMNKVLAFTIIGILILGGLLKLLW